MTVATAAVPKERQADLDGCRALEVAGKPGGLLRTELLRGRDGDFALQTVWRDRAALIPARDPGTPRPAPALLDEVGASHSHDAITSTRST